MSINIFTRLLYSPGMNQILLTVMRSGNIWCGEWGAVISVNKTCHTNTLVIPVLRAFVADSVLYKVGGGELVG